MPLNIPLRHIPPLFIATSITFGGTMPFFNAEFAIAHFGLPNHFATSKPAQAIVKLSSSRISAIGVGLLSLYFQQNFAAFDTVLVTLGYVGLVDGYVCWREGVHAKKWLVHTLPGLAMAAWGWFGMTQGN